VTTDPLGEYNLVDHQARVVEDLDDRVPAVDGDEPVFGRGHYAWRRSNATEYGRPVDSAGMPRIIVTRSRGVGKSAGRASLYAWWASRDAMAGSRLSVTST